MRGGYATNLSQIKLFVWVFIWLDRSSMGLSFKDRVYELHVLEFWCLVKNWTKFSIFKNHFLRTFCAYVDQFEISPKNFISDSPICDC